MPLMWELPEIFPGSVSPKVWLRLKHGITTTSYDVRVVRGPAGDGGAGLRAGKRVAVGRLGGLPLTGLARKILRAASIL